MSEATNGVINKGTLVPIGLLGAFLFTGISMIGLAISVTYSVATDRAMMMSYIQNNTRRNDDQDKQINKMQEQMDYVARALYRIEAKLGTQMTSNNQHEVK